MALQIVNPALAGRSCDLCKRFHFDEKSGMPVKARDGSNWEPRRGKVPCEASIGCAKGHWKNKPDLTVAQREVLDLFLASKASGGAMLNEDERNDWFLQQVFARCVEDETRAAEKKQYDMLCRLFAAEVGRA